MGDRRLVKARRAIYTSTQSPSAVSGVVNVMEDVCLAIRASLLTFAALLICAFSSSIAQGATLPAGFAETRVATGLASPTAMAFAPDGRLFVAQQGGALRVIKNGALLSRRSSRSV